MAVRPGEVIRVWDRQVNPPKFKRLICISSEKQLFLRINSRALFKPHHLLLASESDFLDYDSYVELRQLIRPYAYEIQQAEPLGQLSAKQAMSLISSAHNAETLPQEHKDLIAESLAAV